jgi:hypothetical protein
MGELVEMRVLCYGAAHLVEACSRISIGLLLICWSLIIDAAGENLPPSDTDVETVVFLRDGEKPPGGWVNWLARV